MKYAQQQHRSNSYKYEHSRENDRSSKQESLKPIQSPTGDGHEWNLPTGFSI